MKTNGTGSFNKNFRKNNKKPGIFDFFLYGRWEDLDRWKWVVIDVGVILDTLASHSENLLFSTFGPPAEKAHAGMAHT